MTRATEARNDRSGVKEAEIEKKRGKCIKIDHTDKLSECTNIGAEFIWG
jgi:hypothetical protein